MLTTEKLDLSETHLYDLKLNYIQATYISRLFTMKALIIPFVFLLLFNSANAQNLVPNGNFEYKKRTRNTSRPWRFINTVDFFVDKGKVPKGTENWHKPKAKEGIGYVGIRIYPKYREFIQIKLPEKLEASTKYYFEMWVSWSDHSNYYAKSLGASFYRRKPSYTSKHFIFTNPPQINAFDNEGIVQDSSRWTKISGVHRSNGTEKYLTIGNFSKKKFKDRLKKTKWWHINLWHHEAYYYIDDIKLVEIEEETFNSDSLLVENMNDSILLEENDNYIYAINKDSTLVAENIQFASGENKLLPRSFKDLELILEYLNENPSKKIQIIGHTDNVGNANSNQKLSERRAKSVYNYFIQNYMSKNRITYIGMGETSPIASNDDNLGKRANRRVELKLVD